MEDFLNELLLLVGSAALTLLGVALTATTAWVAKKIKSERISSIVMRADDLALKVVRDIFQVYVSELKKGKADGKLTDEEKAHAKLKAKDQLRTYLGTKGLKELGWLLGGGDLDGFLGTLIENAVTDSKNVGAAVSGAPTADPS